MSKIQTQKLNLKCEAAVIPVSDTDRAKGLVFCVVNYERELQLRTRRIKF